MKNQFKKINNHFFRILFKKHFKSSKTITKKPDNNLKTYEKLVLLILCRIESIEFKLKSLNC